MKTYLLFAGNNYYPGGGLNDYRGDFDSINEAVEHFNAGGFVTQDTNKLYPMRWDWYQIVLSVDMSLVTSDG